MVGGQSPHQASGSFVQVFDGISPLLRARSSGSRYNSTKMTAMAPLPLSPSSASANVTLMDYYNLTYGSNQLLNDACLISMPLKNSFILTGGTLLIK